jgi:CDP-6-deoxy-D-xylo-4-hexulose-3-dehydrase
MTIYSNSLQEYSGVITPWLAYPLVIKKNKYFSRKDLQIYFEKNNIQTRTIFTGNILKQPIMKNRNYKKHKNTDRVADDVMRNGILLGCHHGLRLQDLNYICNTFKKLIDK